MGPKSLQSMNDPQHDDLKVSNGRSRKLISLNTEQCPYSNAPTHDLSYSRCCYLANFHETIAAFAFLQTFADSVAPTIRHSLASLNLRCYQIKAQQRFYQTQRTSSTLLLALTRPSTLLSSNPSRVECDE